MEKEDFLVRFAYKTPDGTLLESRHVHDYRSHEDANGKIYMIDGGIFGYYTRSSVNLDECENLCVYYSDGHEIVRDVKFWGTQGKSGKEETRVISVAEMDFGHLLALVEGNFGSERARRIFKDEIDYRRLNVTN